MDRFSLPIWRFILWATALMSVFWLTACGGGNAVVVLETNKGEIVIDVFEQKSPLSAADFLYYVDNGLYDNQGFYRVVRPETDPRNMGMELIQGGLLSQVPVTQSIDHERTDIAGLSNIEGAVAIARDAPGTGSAAYFFISLADNSYLDYGGTRNPDGQGYAVFGHVTKGLDVARAIQALPSGGPSTSEATEGQFLIEPVRIVRAYRK